MPHPSYSPDVTPSNFFWFPLDEKIPQRETFADVEEVKQKMAEALRGINQWVQKLFWAVEKHLNRYVALNGEYFEDDWSLKMYK